MQRSIFFITIAIGLLWFTSLPAQSGYWQQQADYTIRVKLKPDKHTLEGFESIVYTNNSPDTLRVIYFHLYYNAFQPGSAMDIRSRTIADPDRRVGDRISKLKPHETGEYFIKAIEVDGHHIKDFIVDETILEVKLAKPLLPGKTATIKMEFESQIPVQIRRTGRYNSEGVAYSMAQWYPKLCEYDRDGWATDPYIGREFYGVWGNFDVYITLPDSFKIAGTGELISKIETPEMTLSKEGKLSNDKWVTWFFRAEKVHDYVWAADPDYIIEELKVNKDLKLIFAYKKSLKAIDNWKKLQPVMAEAITYASRTFGKYPYKQYSFIQGGDGGMEYPMATLIMGELSMQGLTSVSVHEMMHSWYQGVLGMNESVYAWMDEGFTSYAETRVKNHLQTKNMYPGDPDKPMFAGDNATLTGFLKRGSSEPMNTHADHFNTNAAYGVSSYVKGSVFLSQLGYVIGEPALNKSLLIFYDEWKFKHPTDLDFMRIAERVSGMELGWYHQYMLNRIELPDLAIDTVFSTSANETMVVLGNHSIFPMPVDVVVEDTNNNKRYFTIPVNLMRKAKQSDLKGINWTPLPAWNWVHPYYELLIDMPKERIRSIHIDPSARLADLNPADNTWPQPE